MSTPSQWLQILADGRFHSGAELGAAFGVSRAAVWKRLRQLRERYGLEVSAVRGRGYRLVRPFELLQPQAIEAQLAARVRDRVPCLDVLFEVDSTNRWMMGQAQHGAPSGQVCFAEYQSGGRGRRGRRWSSPLGGNIYMSVLWRFANGASAVGGLSLVAGLAVVEALSKLGIDGLGLKWPNDIVWAERKLAGVLLELSGEASGPCHVVIGVGLNVRLDSAAAADIDQPWVDLHQIGGSMPARAVVAGAVLSRLVERLISFESEGLASALMAWPRWDALHGRAITVWQGDQAIAGTALGVDESGALLLQVSGGVRQFVGGEVSVRPATRG
ncbi:MAG: hypothetical protein AMJ69_11565 [Gammaproteobacteria bacterium SG8_47]|nr:MAG: hypothetical protein AMJ69_11565 [Gammaproteobacteria bacterium SG8_47]